MKVIRINEIFKSIDGEVNGFLGAGQWATFIRFQGCNLRCKYCDTVPSQTAKCDLGKQYQPYVLATKIKAGEKVTITGGEPLIQPLVFTLIDTLLRHGHKITVETNGSVYIPPAYFKEEVRWVVDYKLPSAGLDDYIHNVANFDDLRSCDIIKFVCCNTEDYEVVKEVVKLSYDWKARKVLSWPIDAPTSLVEAILFERDNRFQVQFQLHKAIGCIWDITVK